MEKLFIRNMQIDRSKIFIAKNNNALDEQDIEYWDNASNEEKFQTITYLRECFYGDDATNGHVQRSHTIFNRAERDVGGGSEYIDGPDSRYIDPADYPDTTSYLNAIPGCVERLLASRELPSSAFKPLPKDFFDNV